MGGRFMPAGGREAVDVGWGRVGSVCVPSSTAATKLAVLEARLFAGTGHAFHKHPSQEEVIFVLSGRIEQWLDRDQRILEPGDAAFIPPGMVHASYNVGDGEAVLLAIFGPAIGTTGAETVDVFTEAPWRDLRR